MLTLYNHCTDPFYNQALEEYLFTHVTEDDLFYLWRNQPVVVVGRYQNICREVSVPLLRRKKIPVVRRISGGGTVYHDLGNINYTYMLSPHGLVDYAACLEPVVTALQDMGLAASQSGICDIVIGKKKISGSAQRSAKGRLLHHGTLLFQTELDQLQEITMQHKTLTLRQRHSLCRLCCNKYSRVFAAAYVYCGVSTGATYKNRGRKCAAAYTDCDTAGRSPSFAPREVPELGMDMGENTGLCL